LIETVGTDIESYSDSGLDASTTYFYRVRTEKKINSYTGYSNTVILTQALMLPLLTFTGFVQRRKSTLILGIPTQSVLPLWMILSAL
jgi:hypothetical protein